MQNFLALVPLALLLGEVTEDLALRFGDVIGGLLNATFGNVVRKVTPLAPRWCSLIAAGPAGKAGLSPPFQLSSGRGAEQRRAVLPAVRKHASVTCKRVLTLR